MLKYYLFSKQRKGYGIHSPFIFDLVSRVFRNKINPDIVLKVESIRKKNISDKREISFKDLGAGSKIMKSGRRRKISDITKYSSVPARFGILLSRLAAEFGGGVIIELGTSVGISTMYLAAGSPGSFVYTMEADEVLCNIARGNFEEAGIKNVKAMEGSFDDLLPRFADEGITPGLVFIDGNHRKEAVLNYVGKMIEIADDRTVIVLDDIYYSKDMVSAWDQVKGNPSVSATVDIGRMGIIFLRKGLMRFNYKIRY